MRLLKKTSNHWLALATLLIAANAYAEPNANEIVQKAENRFAGKAYQSDMTMTITPKNGDSKVRTFSWWGQSKGSKWDYMIKFKSPSALKNSGLLVIGTQSSKPAQWIYMSAVGKRQPRRVAESDKGNPFLGSDFYYIDFEKLVTSDFKHSLIKTIPCGKATCAVIESTPKISDFPYSKIVATINLSNYVPITSELYEQGKLTKIYTVDELENIDGVWTPKKTTMTNRATNSVSTITIKTIEYKTSINSSILSDGFLKSDIF